MHFETRAIHAGQQPDPATGAIITPIYQTSTYVQYAIGVHQGYDYSRAGNPTRTALEQNLASLEGARTAPRSRPACPRPHAPRSPGDHVVAGNNLYGGSPACSAGPPARAIGSRSSPDDISNGLSREFASARKFLFIETPTNPMLVVFDIAALRRPRSGRRAARRRQHVRLALLPATARTGRRRRGPLVDEVPRRALRRHRRVRRDERRRDGRAPRVPPEAVGAVPARSTRGSCSAARRRSRCGWSATRRTRALSPRSSRRRRERGVQACSTRGCRPPRARDRARQMRNFGGMISFVLERAGGRRAHRAHAVCTLAESLGGVESLVEHPARMTHASTADAPFAVPRTLDPALRRDRVGRRPDHRSRVRARGMTVAPIDLHHPAPGSSAATSLETPDGPALFDCGPTTCVEHLKAGLASADSS